MKFLFATLLICLGFSAQGQTQAFLVTYEVEFIDNSKHEGINLIRQYADIDAVEKEIEFELYCDSNKSLFQIVDKVYSDDFAIDMAMTSLMYFGSVLQTEGQSIEAFFDKGIEKGKAVILDRNIDWKILKETKNIGSISCRKANGIMAGINDKGVKYSIPFEAWFAPELTYSYGPLGYQGLPGLILELHTSGYVIHSRKITYDIQNRNSGIFKSLDRISEKDMDTLVKNLDTSIEIK